MRSLAIVIFSLILFVPPSALAQSRSSATVTVTISVAPIANIDFPNGTDFIITVPRNASPNGATIQPVRIPFTVRGNPIASVSARPDVFLQTNVGAFYGLALGPDGGSEPLGYDIVVQFPVPSQNHAGLPTRGGFGNGATRDNYANLPSVSEDPTPPLAVDMVQQKHTAYGTIHLVARHGWTPDGRSAKAGKYSGSINVTVTTDER
jgi:hypothetical protein